MHLCYAALKTLAPIPEEGSRGAAGTIPAGNKLLNAYPGLEPDTLPEGAPLFKFKAQAYQEDENLADRIGAGAAQSLAVYNMTTETAPMTFREMPLNAAMSISPRETLRRSLLGRTSSSIGPEGSALGYEDAGLMRSRSSLMQRSGSVMSQYVDSEVCHAGYRPMASSTQIALASLACAQT